MQKKIFLSVLFVMLSISYGWSATSNTSNNPTFLVIDAIVTNFSDMAPDTLDIGVDIGADGTYEYWVSEDPAQVLDNSRRGGTSTIAPGNWRSIVINLDEYGGEGVQAKIKIVDNSDSHLIAVNSVRLNFADGTMVPNNVPNGYLEEADLAGWTVLEGSMTAADLLQTDEGLDATAYSTQYINTTVAGTATIESDAFELTPVSSFIYGAFGGPASSFFDKPEAYGDLDNNIKVYVDLGTTEEDPDGTFTEGEDIPLYGFLFRGPDGGLESVIINTSGYEERRAQFVLEDMSSFAAVSADAIRMNWDNSIIRNGGFEETFETGVPEGFDGQSVRLVSEHPSGGVPGWTQNVISTEGFDPESSFTFFGNPAGGFSRGGYVWIGSGSFFDGQNDDGLQGGIELRSDVFVIEEIPDPASSVFMSFNSAQSSDRIDAFPDEEGNWERGTIQLQVDTNDDGVFDSEDDFIYTQINQSISWVAEQSGDLDEWHYPEYRFYIDSEHQGRQGRIYVEETMTGGWAWMAADDFYFWDGSEAQLAFENSDFENGDMTNWNEEELNDGTATNSWLAANAENPVAPATHAALNGYHPWVDGDWSIDSAPNGAGSGDNSVGKLWSEPFEIPSVGTGVNYWSLME